MRELRQYIERNDLVWQSLCNEIDASRRTVSEKACGAMKMPNEVWIESHQSRTREIRGDRVVGKDDFAEKPSSSM